MTTIHIFFGTESGNAEMAADDIADILRSQGFDTTISELSDAAVDSLAELGTAVLITSTYGEGDLPETAAPFHTALLQSRPDLSRLHFAAFGLGDSGYETFNNGIDILRAAFSDLGAQQIGETARHDAATGEPVTDLAASWAASLMSAIPA
jgi:MioC protein